MDHAECGLNDTTLRYGSPGYWNGAKVRKTIGLDLPGVGVTVRRPSKTGNYDRRNRGNGLFCAAAIVSRPCLLWFLPMFDGGRASWPLCDGDASAPEREWLQPRYRGLPHTVGPREIGLRSAF